MTELAKERELSEVEFGGSILGSRRLARDLINENDSGYVVTTKPWWPTPVAQHSAWFNGLQNDAPRK